MENKIASFIAFLSLVMSGYVYAASDTVTAVPVAAATTLNLTSTQTDLIIASSVIGTTGSAFTNKTYRYWVTSQNGGLRNLNAVTKGASVANATIPYQIEWGSSSKPVSSLVTLTINTTTAQQLFTYKDSGSVTSINGKLWFSITGASAASLYSGEYSDRITVTSENTYNGTSKTASFNIKSNVIGDTMTFVVTPTAVANNLPLGTTQDNLQVGLVSITANCQNGYTLQVSSSNGSRLVHYMAGGSPSANEQIPYTLDYGGTSLTLSTTPITMATNNSATLLTTSTQIGTVGISYTGVNPAQKLAGTYQDILTFTLQSQ